MADVAPASCKRSSFRKRKQRLACKWHAHAMKAVITARGDASHMLADYPHAGGMTQQKRNSSQTAPRFFSSVTAPCVSSRQCLQVFGRRSHEFPSTSGHSTNCWPYT